MSPHGYAEDPHNEQPEDKNCPESNFNRMPAFHHEYPHIGFVPQPVAQMRAAVEHGWSVDLADDTRTDTE